MIKQFISQKEVDQSTNEILEQALDAVVTIDHNNNVTFFNAAAENLWGLHRDQVLGKNVKMLVPESIRDSHDHYVDSNRSSGINKIVGTAREIQVTRSDGSQVWCELSLSKVGTGEESNYTAFVKDITEIRNARETMQQTLEQAIDAVVTIDENNNITFFNKAAENLWGYERDEVLGQNVKMLVPKAIQSNHDGYVNRNRETGENKIVGTSREIEVPRKDGSTVWCNLALSKVEVDGKIVYTAFVKDITKERDARETNNQTLEQAVDAVVTIDEHNNVTFFNTAAEKLWGYSREQVVGQNVRMLVPKAIQANHDSYVDANRETGENKIVGTSREIEVPRADGSTVWCNLALSKVEVSGKISYTAFVKDVTKEHEAREVINQTLEQAIDAVVTIDEHNNVTFFNAAAEKLWGYQRDEVIGQNVKLLVPHEIQKHHDGYVNANRNSGINKIVGTSREVPVFRKDGSQVWGNLSLSRVNVGGKTLYTAFVKDVTEEVNNRERMETLSLVADETDNSVVITDAKGRIEYVNPGFTRLTGYSFEEVAGKTPGSMLQGELTDKNTVAKIRERLADAKPFYEEILNYTKSGEPYWISLSINPIFDARGQVRKFVSVQANVTETKQNALESSSRMDAIRRSNAVVEWSPKGELVDVNESFAKIVGRTVDEVLQLKQAYSLGSILESNEVAQVSAGQHLDKNLTLNISDQEIFISANIQPIRNYQGDISRIVMYASDQTQRRAAINESSALMTDVLGKISQIASDISTISKQTNLLSLNAGIESAQAGDAGQGFSIIAGEIRRLATGSSSSAKEINDMISTTREKIDELNKVHSD